MQNSKLVERAVENLLSNSIKYSKVGTRIEIDARSNNSHMIISVKDQGRGIQKHELELIFDRFYRTGDRVEGSTGLGLSIVRGIAEAHHGRAWAKSDGMGKGSTVYLQLPVTQDRAL